jgi:hypothetical protein
LAREQADHAEKMTARAQSEKQTGKKPGGRPPAPPVPGPAATDQVKLTDAQSRIMRQPATVSSRLTMPRRQSPAAACWS